MNIHIGSIVTFKGAFCAAEVKSINGKMAVIDHCGELVTKRISSLVPYVRKEAYWNEQDLAAGQAKYNHGDVVFSVIDADGNSGNWVWDENLQDTVRKKSISRSKQK